MMIMIIIIIIDMSMRKLLAGSGKIKSV